MDRFTKRIITIITGYSIFIIIIFFIFRTVFMIRTIPSGSMEGTIMTGDVVFATRYDVSEKEIERFDILVFIPPDDPDEQYIKRVIGLPGETVEVRNGSVYVDGTEIDDSFIKNPMNRKGDGVYVVPEGCYFFLGDNRNQSKDSRFWKQSYVPQENIVGKAKCVVFPFTGIRSIEYCNRQEISLVQTVARGMEYPALFNGI